MKFLLSASAALALAVVATSCTANAPANAPADEPDCDLAVGDLVGAYQVVKAGGFDDGVEAGAKLCYM